MFVSTAVILTPAVDFVAQILPCQGFEGISSAANPNATIRQPVARLDGFDFEHPPQTFLNQDTQCLSGLSRMALRTDQEGIADFDSRFHNRYSLPILTRMVNMGRQVLPRRSTFI
jgi:hypothetical protein